MLISHTRFPLKPLLVVLAGLLALHSPARSAENAPVGIDSIPICLNFSCKTRQNIAITQEEWDSVANWLRPAATDAAGERENIKKAIGWMEVIVGRHTPSHRDVAGDLKHPGAHFPGQLDCIDESLNTTTYLQLLEQNELLSYHKVVERAYRRAIFDQHWAGQIEETANGELWVVDSWFQHNGFLPYLQRTEEWEDIPFFTANLDSSQPQPEEESSFFRRIFN